MREEGGPVARALGGCLGAILPLYFTVGMTYGELQAWRDMGWVSLLSPATQFYVVWYSLTWPYQMFNGGGDPVVRGTIIGFGVVDDSKETYLTDGCKRFDAMALGWNESSLGNVTAVGNHLVREGKVGPKRIFVLEFTDAQSCEYEFGRLVGAYEAGTVDFDGLYTRALATDR